MELILLKQALEDRDYWKRSDNKTIMKRISKLLADILEHPFTGIGKPEPLVGNLSGKWSQRINSEHDSVPSVGRQDICICLMRYHYSK